MRLADRLRGRDGAASAASVDAATKERLHARLVEDLDFGALSQKPREEVEPGLREALHELARAEALPLNRFERMRLVEELLDEVLGFGPLEPLLSDPDVQDVLVNGPADVWVEREGRLSRTAVCFRDEAHLRQVIDRIVAGVGRRVDESSPMVDARLPDGSRVNVILPPLSLKGPALSIRKFGREPLGMEDLIARRSLIPPIRDYLAAAVASRLNLLVSGGTGSGKTTLLNALSAFVPADERIVTIEDSAELQLRQPHVVTLEARPPNLEGRGEVKLADLVKNSLRMRPDRILVGEARGPEVMDMLQAMNTGHPGSMSTVHANSPLDALSRIEVMASMGSHGFSERALRRLVASAIDVVVQVARFADGSRRVVSVSELVGLSDGMPRLEERMGFEQRSVDDQGRIQGEFRGTGGRSHFADRLAAQGHALDDAWLHHRVSSESLR